MSLLGIDVGTTGCKAVVFADNGRILGNGYYEYDIQTGKSGQAELAVHEIWTKVQDAIRSAVKSAGKDDVAALSVSSLGEATVPVTKSRKVVGPSLLMTDMRGQEFLDDISAGISSLELYRTNGNLLGNHYSLPKLIWLKNAKPEVYDQTDYFLHWASFVAFMLGAEPFVDYSLANRSLLFDLENKTWSKKLLEIAGLEESKLPSLVQSGTKIGVVSDRISEQLGLPRNVAIVAGAHDQCANAVGCGVIEEHQAMYGMGTYLCLTPVFRHRPRIQDMMKTGLNTEHHAVPGRYVSFIYNQGGSLVKWFRDTFASHEHKEIDAYVGLMAEMPDESGGVFVLPYFSSTGPPDFYGDSAGMISGLKLSTTRGEILRGILEGMTFYIKGCMDAAPAVLSDILSCRPVGGGSKSDAWIQISSDILGVPFEKTSVSEAGALGAAIIAGSGCGFFSSISEGVESMVLVEKIFAPNHELTGHYARRYERYLKLAETNREFL